MTPAYPADDAPAAEVLEFWVEHIAGWTHPDSDTVAPPAWRQEVAMMADIGVTITEADEAAEILDRREVRDGCLFADGWAYWRGIVWNREADRRRAVAGVATGEGKRS